MKKFLLLPQGLQPPPQAALHLVLEGREVSEVLRPQSSCPSSWKGGTWQQTLPGSPAARPQPPSPPMAHSSCTSSLSQERITQGAM